MRQRFQNRISALKKQRKATPSSLPSYKIAAMNSSGPPSNTKSIGTLILDFPPPGIVIKKLWNINICVWVTLVWLFFLVAALTDRGEIHYELLGSPCSPVWILVLISIQNNLRSELTEYLTTHMSQTNYQVTYTWDRNEKEKSSATKFWKTNLILEAEPTENGLETCSLNLARLSLKKKKFSIRF